ncbi:hypothetical protein [Sessilibacter corallicola]|uniref:hypothetical protein n=1 Tax=Sessilibacter corallicola TaxID=2904075 RepID=UPI001E397430|nr:hypothetical protein [Sessilibacter corallicola]MCE2027488.1 hypothetical protein [Sessilibacter corallicola]
MRHRVESILGSAKAELYNRPWPYDERIRQCRQKFLQITECKGFCLILSSFESVFAMNRVFAPVLPVELVLWTIAASWQLWLSKEHCSS